MLLNLEQEMSNMNLGDRFSRYYLNYLGISLQELNNGKDIFECKQREKPLNLIYFQHLIVTNIDGINAFSITPAMYNDFSNYIKPWKDLDMIELSNKLKIFYNERLKKYTIKQMYRMTMNSRPKDFEISGNVIKLTKDILMVHLQDEKEEEKAKIWSRKKEEVIQGRQYVILENNKIVSYCKVSDINYCGGNLVVYTNEKYRCKGYGKAVVTGAMKWCDENDIIPVYWVDKNNLPSIQLAKCLGFQIRAEEIVVGNN